MQANFITDDTEAIASQANEDVIAAIDELATDVKRFDGLKLPPVLDRKFKLLKLSLFSLTDPKEREEVTRLERQPGSGVRQRESVPEGAGKHAGKCLPIGEVEQALARQAVIPINEGSLESLARCGRADASEVQPVHPAAKQGSAGIGFSRTWAQCCVPTTIWRPSNSRLNCNGCGTQVRPLYESLHVV